jgi:alkylated DNA nucleotide flippase Atl1
LTVASEARFESEERLHRAIAEHPDVLPSEDIGMGPLVTVANELDLGPGPLDTLVVDAAGRVAIIEFKRGTENPDVRKVVAQVIDYGASLWRLTYEDLEQRARLCDPGFDGSLADHVAEHLRIAGVETFDPEAFIRGVESCLASGEFVFLYVARDLDERTKRIMTYLAEGPRMTFFAVEVDYFRTDRGGSVLVPRVAFVPSWVAEQTRPARGGGSGPPALVLEDAPEVVRLLAERMDELSTELGLVVSHTRASRIYRPARNAPGVGLYLDGRKVEFDLECFRKRGEDDFAEDFLARLDAIAGVPVRRGPFPSVRPKALLAGWETQGRDHMRRYFEARLLQVADDGEAGLDVEHLHQLLTRVPAGRWTNYGDVAAMLSTHPKALGGHIGNCPDCPNAWRVLQVDGRVSPGFRWTDPANRSDPRQLLIEEGVTFAGERAAPASRLSRTDLQALLAASP